MVKRLEQLKCFLLKCGYPINIIEKGFHNAKLQGPAPQPTKSENIIPLVTTHYANIKFQPIVKKVKAILKETAYDDELKEIFENTQVVLAEKQPPNLLSQLSSAKFSSHPLTTTSLPNGIFRCKRKNCKICQLYLQQVDNFIVSNGVDWKVKCNITCNSKNVIYYLKCNKCNGATTYIGKTNDLRLRTNNHISSCRSGHGPNKFDRHVFRCNGFTTNDCEPFFQLFVLIKLKDEKLLLTYESHFHRLGFDTINRKF